MVCSAMAVQDQCGGTRPNLIIPSGNGISLSATPHNATGHQLKEQFSCGSDYSPKARKPYTITKQRERWTDEEHKKFLEALRLYGRAWRRIEEHVGTKTAVQIRSHAQKFFSKVVRESGGSNTFSVEQIEIPPPRPKRKPKHPYPRKLALPQERELLIPEKSVGLSSPNFSISEQENQSPTSVLSAVGSDTLGSTDSNTANRSASPVSSADGLHPGDLSLSEPNSSPEDNRSPSPATVCSNPDQQYSKMVLKLDSSPKQNMDSKEPLAEESSTPMRSLKLFGMTVLVTESQRPSSPNIGTSKILPLEAEEEKPVQPLKLNITAAELQSVSKENSGPMAKDLAPPMPWWAFYGGMPFPFIPFHKQEPTKGNLDSSPDEVVDKEIQKEGSWTGSNSGSVNEGENADNMMDVETESLPLSPPFEPKPTKKPVLYRAEAIGRDCTKGFVPYKKRCLSENQSSTITREEREEQRIWLCL